MSLLNDMLRDLQQQKHYQTPAADGTAINNTAVPVGSDQRLLQQSSIIKKAPVLWIPSLLVFVTVLIGLLLAKPYFFSPGNPGTYVPNAINTQAAVELPEPRNQVIQNQSQQNQELETHAVKDRPDADIESATPAPLSPPATSEVVNHNVPPQSVSEVINEAQALDEIQQLKIYDLLQEAARALTMERLTTPIEDNAHHYYQQILLIDPKNPAALQGLNKIVQRYLAMADAKLAVLDTDRAERLVDLAESVRADSPSLAMYREKILHARTDATNLVDTGITENTYEAGADQTTGNPFMENNSLHEPVVASSVSIQEPFTKPVEPQHLAIAPNATWQDKKSVEEARLLLENDNLTGAIKVLKNAIASASKPSASTKMLLDIYCQQQLTSEADALLATADYLQPVEQAYYKAKVALLNNQQVEAIRLLETQHASAEDYEQYRALLASLYQNTARYREAASHYRRLITAYGNKPAYWLGFALALDALEQKTSALQAYQRLTEFRNLQSEVRTYADQRIIELTPSRVVSE